MSRSSTHVPALQRPANKDLSRRLVVLIPGQFVNSRITTLNANLLGRGCDSRDVPLSAYERRVRLDEDVVLLAIVDDLLLLAQGVELRGVAVSAGTLQSAAAA